MLYLVTKARILGYNVAFAHVQDRATLRSDLSGSWDFISRSGVLTSLLFNEV